MHFTAVSSIAATFELRFSAGIGPAATGEHGWLPMPTIGGSTGEIPTLSIVPMQGQEFAERLLRPFDEAKVALLLSQGYDVDALLRLLAAGFLPLGSRDGLLSQNAPASREGYVAFRRVVAHLSSVQDRHLLRVAPVRFTLHRVTPAASMSPDTLRELSAESTLRYDAERQVYEHDATVTGRTLVSNYDPQELSNDERQQLHERMARLPANAVMIDVRAGIPGGEVPIHGAMLMRRFLHVLEFVGRGVAVDPEFDVAPDPRTPLIQENPARALAVIESASAPSDASLSVSLDAMHYSLARDVGYPWNRRAFAILYQLFQLTLATPRVQPPLISVGT